MGFEKSEEQVRPEYTAANETFRTNPVTGMEEVYMPASKLFIDSSSRSTLDDTNYHGLSTKNGTSKGSALKLDNVTRLGGRGLG